MAVPMTPQEVDQALGVVRSTLPHYSRKIINETQRKRKLFKLLEAFNRISRNCTGTMMIWNVIAKLAEVVAGVRLTNIVFPDIQYNDHFQLPWRGYYTADSVHDYDVALNSGPEALFNLWDTKMKMMGVSINQALASEFFKDGSLAANANCWHGLETFLKFTSCASTDKVATPSGSYAGRSCVLGALGGSWTSALGVGNYPNATLAKDWPMGQGDPMYDHNSGLGLNWHASNWGSSAQTWIANCEYVMRYALEALSRNGGLADEEVQNSDPVAAGLPEDEIQNVSGSPPFMHALSTDLYLDVKNHFAARNYQFVPLPSMVELGFGDMLMLDGAVIDSDWTIAPGVGYGLSLGAMELRLMGQSDIVAIKGPFHKPEEERSLAYMKTQGNLRFRAKSHAKYAKFTSS